jgi:hypothetical protein
MRQKYLSKIEFFTLCASLLLISSFFSGCIQNSVPSNVTPITVTTQSVSSNAAPIPDDIYSATSNGAPITVTTYSAYKTTEINGITAQSGSVFVIINMTIDNHGKNDYTFNENSVSITNGTPVEENQYARFTGRGYWGAIPPNEQRNGDVIFEVTDSTQDVTPRFFYHNKQESFPLDLGTVPMRAGSVLLETPVSTADNTPSTLNAGDTASQGPVSLTINSISKASRINDYGIGNGTRAMQGHVFVILDVSIKNNGIPEGFVFTDKSTTMKNLADNYYVGLSLNGLPEVKEDLKNAIIPPVTIAQNQAITGKIIFGITDSDSYGMNLVGSNKTILAKKHILFTGNTGKVTPNNGSGNGTGSSGLSSTTKSDSG